MTTLDRREVLAREVVPARVWFGIGRAQAHHGELLQGVFEVSGRLTRALVTLPCGLFESKATVRLRAGDALRVVPAWRRKALRAAELTLERLGLSGLGGELVLRSSVPVGFGFGSSTADVVAAIRAVLAATGRSLGRREVAELAVLAEAASDPLMFERAVLFAQREGRILEDFGRPRLALEIVGFAARDGAGTDTLRTPLADYLPEEVAEFGRLRALARHAFRVGDARALGRVASASSRLNQRHLPIEAFSALQRLLAEVGAVGLQVAHSGNVAGLLFDAADACLERRIERARERLAALGIARTWRFTAGATR